jgi:response regulator RpfG family c-di-GMP phosphodiesterase
MDKNFRFPLRVLFVRFSSMAPILFFDDSEADLIVQERVLRGQCKILNPLVWLKSRNDCLAFFEGTGVYQKRSLPCVMFLDLMMPFPGVDILKELKHKQLLRDSIIIMLSGLQDIKAIHEGYQLGARTFLVKPLRMEDVVQTLSTLKGIRINKEEDGHIIVFESQTGDSSNVEHPRISAAQRSICLSV